MFGQGRDLTADSWVVQLPLDDIRLTKRGCQSTAVQSPKLLLRHLGHPGPSPMVTTPLLRSASMVTPHFDFTSEPARCSNVGQMLLLLLFFFFPHFSELAKASCLPPGDWMLDSSHHDRLKVWCHSEGNRADLYVILHHVCWKERKTGVLQEWCHLVQPCRLLKAKISSNPELLGWKCDWSSDKWAQLVYTDYLKYILCVFPLHSDSQTVLYGCLVHRFSNDDLVLAMSLVQVRPRTWAVL